MARDDEEPPNDEGAERGAAIATAAKAARWISRTDFEGSVEAAERRVEEFKRALYSVESRTFELVAESTSKAKKKELTDPPSPPDLSPWEVDPAKLEAETRTKCVCWTCGGEKKVNCPRCGGSARVLCPECGGSGRVRGQRQLTKNCPNCRGRGTVGCLSCHRGRVECPDCKGTGCVEAWITVERAQRFDFKTTASDQVFANYPALTYTDHFTTDPAEWPFELIDERVVQNPVVGSPYRDGATPAIDEDVQPDIDAKTDRVLSSRIQKLRTSTWEIGYRTLFGAGRAFVDPRRGVVLASSDFTPFTRRLVGAAVGGLIVFVSSIALFGAFVGRHEWYERYGSGLVIAAFGVVAAVATSLAVLGLSLPSRTFSVVKSWVPLAIAVASTISMVAYYKFQGPTAAEARSALRAGADGRAELAANALVSLGIDPEAGGEVLDELHVRRLAAAPSMRELARVARELWYVPANRDKAVSTVEATVKRRMDELYGAADTNGLRQLGDDAVGLNEARVLGPVRDRIAVLELEACSANKNYDCVTSRLPELDRFAFAQDRVASIRTKTLEALRFDIAAALAQASSEASPHTRYNALKTAVLLGERHQALSGQDVTPPLAELRARADIAGAQVAEIDRREQARREQEERRLAETREREARQAQATRERESRRTLGTPRRGGGGGNRVVCADGSFSPSCSCGGSLRGCCSHHGGVAGCQ